MGKVNEKRLRAIEKTHRPPPYREMSFGWRSEEEYVRLIALGRAGLAGDAAAEALFNQLLDRPPLPDPRPLHFDAAMSKDGLRRNNRGTY